ncbi:MAG TPA: STAS domain-containing protein [Candidatus Acidoferrales bacterium]|nr:STAS domain-containing protein [Candidatus Acidoferrales bacterium]
MAATPAAPAPELKLNTEKSPAQTIVHVSGRVTARSAELLLNTVRPLIPETKRLLLDLSHLEYLDSSGLGTVVRLWMTSKKANCELKVINLSPRIKDLFTLTNISSIFEGVEHAGM